MRMATIKDVITDKISGEWGDEAVNGQGVFVIRTANFLNSGKINFFNLVRREIDPKKVEKKRLMSGDIIIEKSGGSPTQPVGRVVIFRSPNNDIYLCNNFTSILRPNKNEVYPEFLFYVLRENHKNGKTLRYQNKTIGIINLKLDSYLDSEIPLPPLDDQIRIAHLLGKVESLIAQRKQHLQQLDDLLKSVFLEMFGDPVRNEKGWKAEQLGDIALIERGRFSPRPRNDPKFFGGEYPFIQTGDITRSKGRLREYTQTLNEFGIKVSKEFKAGTIVIAIVGATIGETALLEIPTYAPDSVIGITPKGPDASEAVFIEYVLRFWKPVLRAKAPEAARANINIETLRPLTIIVPPNRATFSDAVIKVEELKVAYRNNLTDLEALYNALSQKAFKGELDLSRVVLPAVPIEAESPVVSTPTQSVAQQIKLPETDLLLPALENRKQLQPLLRFWLESYQAQLGDANFSAADFMAAAQTRLANLHPDNHFELDANDYGHIKNWTFEALAAGRLQQLSNITGHDKNGKPIFGNLIELKGEAQP